MAVAANIVPVRPDATIIGYIQRAMCFDDPWPRAALFMAATFLGVLMN
jgi:hypothetical protein